MLIPSIQRVFSFNFYPPPWLLVTSPAAAPTMPAAPGGAPAAPTAPITPAPEILDPNSRMTVKATAINMTYDEAMNWEEKRWMKFQTISMV